LAIKKQQKYPKIINIHFLQYWNYIKIIIIVILISIIELYYIYYINSFILKDEKIIELKYYNKFKLFKDEITDSSIVKLLNKIKVIKHIFNKNIEKDKIGKKVIHITVSVNNKKNYKYILLVQMQSLLMSCHKNSTFIVYHILCTPDFNELSIIIFKSLFISFPHNFELIFYNMGNIFFYFKKIYLYSVAYYRLMTPLFINEERIIHLDVDCLIFSDLNDMYNLDFKGNYILGFYDFLIDGIDYLGIKSSKYINSGVTLFNLKKLRNDKKCVEIIDLLHSNVPLRKPDQTVINYLLYPNIGRLPSKYGIFNFEDKSDLTIYLNLLRTKIPLNELEEALINPGIIHFVLCKPKPWYRNSFYFKDFTNCTQRLNCSCIKYFYIWHSIAKETLYYRKISSFTSVG